MKIFKITFLLILFSLIQSNLIGQIEKQDWKEVNQEVTQNAKSKILKNGTLKFSLEENETSFLKPLTGKSLSNFNAISKGENKLIVEFKEEKKNVIFSVLKYGWMIRKMETLGSSPTLSITGFTSSNKKINPIIAIPNTKNISQANGVITFNQPPSNEITIAFSESISRIEITTNADQKATVAIELSPIYWSNDVITPNPDVNISNCQDININVVLDNSSSMTEEEKNELRNGLMNFLEEEIIGESIKAKIAFIEFDKKAQIGISYLEVNEENISINGGIHNYLFNVYGQSSEHNKQNWTNWEGAFELASTLNKTTPANILLFITDGLPNGNYQKKLTAAESLEKTIKYANQIKKDGTHIYTIGKDDLVGDVAKFWTSWITNGNKTKTISTENKDNPNIDYFVVENFQEISSLVKNALSECDTSFDLDLEAELLANNTSKLQWSIQKELSEDKYSIYRSSDKKNWIELTGQIQTNEANHSFIDLNTKEGRNYYQIKAISNNSKPIASPVRIVKLTIEKLVEIFPNPTKEDVNIIFKENLLENKENCRIELKDIYGKTIPFEMANISNGFHLQLNQLESGTYIINLYEKEKLLHTEKLVIIK